MKRRFLFNIIVLLIIAFSTVSMAQYEIGKNYVGPSVGISFLGSTVQIGVNYEYSTFINNLGTVGIGGIMRIWSYSEPFYAGKWSYTNVLIGVQGNYHFKVNDKRIDPWAGMVLGYNAGSVSWSGPYSQYEQPTAGGFWLGFQGGIRYWISPQIALSARAGFGTISYSLLDIGVDFKF